MCVTSLPHIVSISPGETLRWKCNSQFSWARFYKAIGGLRVLTCTCRRKIGAIGDIRATRSLGAGLTYIALTGPLKATEYPLACGRPLLYDSSISSTPSSPFWDSGGERARPERASKCVPAIVQSFLNDTKSRYRAISLLRRYARHLRYI